MFKELANRIYEARKNESMPNKGGRRNPRLKLEKEAKEEEKHVKKSCC
jgi:hypothetical protein